MDTTITGCSIDRMNLESQNAGRPKPINTNTEQRARVRRNQRNSRARKQAYLESLEKRWGERVRLGAQATTPMQKEAQRVEEENRLLRDQGFDDEAIQRALGAARCTDVSIDQARESLGVVPSAGPSLPPAPIPAGTQTLEGTQGDGTQSLSLDLHNWLIDLYSIKDAFGVQANFQDQAPQNDLSYVSMLHDDSVQVS